MKTLILVLLMAVMSVGAYAADGDIGETEVRQDVVGWKLDTVRFLVFTQTCEVTYRKVGSGDTPLGEVKVIFQNMADNPDTPGDETLTEFTQLITLINNGNNIKQSIRAAVVTKLGL